jgi:NADH-quinone oxidoreductase subunit G
MALLAEVLLKDADLDESERAFFDDLDIGYLAAESNIGDEEFAHMSQSFSRAENRVLVVGSDMFAHARSENIAKLAAMIEKYTTFSLLVVPSEVNTLGVSLICDLDVDENIDNVVGYNAEGNFVISSLEGSDLAIPALNQQEGTVVSIDNRVLPLNAALSFDGYNLNNIANALSLSRENTIDYTSELKTTSGFKAIAFDDLKNFLTPLGVDERGYLLDEVVCEINSELDEIDELPEFNGTIIYHSNPVLQFNAYTNKMKQLERDIALRGSAQFAAAARISDGDEVEISFASTTIKRVFKLDSELKGTIALNPTFDKSVDINRYKFEKSKIVRVV